MPNRPYERLENAKRRWVSNGRGTVDEDQQVLEQPVTTVERLDRGDDPQTAKPKQARVAEIDCHESVFHRRMIAKQAALLGINGRGLADGCRNQPWGFIFAFSDHLCIRD